jgi:heme/copper-type cytochrome/quinol oxidase subunit 2
MCILTESRSDLIDDGNSSCVVMIVVVVIVMVMITFNFHNNNNNNNNNNTFTYIQPNIVYIEVVSYCSCEAV